MHCVKRRWRAIYTRFWASGDWWRWSLLQLEMEDKVEGGEEGQRRSRSGLTFVIDFLLEQAWHEISRRSDSR